MIAELEAQRNRSAMERAIRSAATLAAIPAALAVLPMMLAPGLVLSSLYGAYYRDAAAYLCILSLGQIVNVLTGSAGMTLHMTGHSDVMLRLSGTAVACAAAAGLLVVRHYGALGVAVVVAAQQIALNLATHWFAYRILGVRTHAFLPSFGKGRKS